MISKAVLVTIELERVRKKPSLGPCQGGPPWDLGVFKGGGATDFPLAAVCGRAPRHPTPGRLTGGGKTLASRREPKKLSSLKVEG